MKQGKTILTPRPYKKEMLLTTHNTGRMAAKYYGVCGIIYCQSEVLPQVLHTFSDVLGVNATFIDLVNSLYTSPSKKKYGYDWKFPSKSL